MSVELAIRLKKALEKAKMKPADLSRAIDESPQTVHSWLKTGRIAKQKLAEFARITGEDLGYLMSGEPPHVSEPPPPYPDGAVRDVPIIGFAIATPNEDGFFDDMGFPPGAGEGYIPWPTRDPNSYALRVRGDSMQPRIRPGELLVVEPGAAVGPGDDVVVRTRAGRKMVKQLLMQRSGEVTLGSINQAHRQVTISLEEIESMHRVVAIAPRGAFTKEE